MPTTIRDLSPELVSSVLLFLEREEDQSKLPFLLRSAHPKRFFPQYATISRQWQYAGERVTFASLTLKSTELAYFSEVFTCDSRRAALGTLSYDIVLPMYSDNACGRFENSDDKRRNDEALTEAVYGLFSILKAWEESMFTVQAQIQPRPMQLHISSIYSPMDGPHRGTEKFISDKFQFELGRRHDLFNHRYEHSVIKLCKWDDLPTLSRVNDFRAFLHYPRAVDPSSIAEIAARLPSLKALNWTLNDNEKVNVRQRQENRSNFARSIQRIPRDLLENVRLNYFNTEPSNHNFPASVAQSPSSLTVQTDELSSSLNGLTQSPNLVSVILQGPICISPDLFRLPSGHQAELSMSKDLEDRRHIPWSKIQHFHVNFNLVAPGGGWYFQRDAEYESEDEGEDEDRDEYGDDEMDNLDDSDDVSDSASSSEDEDRHDSFNERSHDCRIGSFPNCWFRTYPNTAKIMPLLKGLAAAATQMPQLKHMSLSAGRTGMFGVIFLSRGEEYYLDGVKGVGEYKSENKEIMQGKMRLYFQTGRWRGEEDEEGMQEVLNLFRQVGGWW